MDMPTNVEVRCGFVDFEVAPAVELNVFSQRVSQSSQSNDQVVLEELKRGFLQHARHNGAIYFHSQAEAAMRLVRLLGTDARAVVSDANRLAVRFAPGR